MMIFQITGELPEILQFPKCRLHLALYKAMHPDGGQLVSLLPTDLENRPIGQPMSGVYWKPDPLPRGKKANPGRPIAAAMYVEFLVAAKGFGRTKAAKAAAEKLCYEEDRSIRNVVKRGRDALTAYGAGCILIFDSPEYSFVFIFHENAAIQYQDSALILEGSCWQWDLLSREAQHIQLRIEVLADAPLPNAWLPDRIRKK